MKKAILRFLFLFIIGGAASLGYAPYYMLPVFILSFLSLIYFIDTAKTKKNSFFYAYVWALGYYCYSLSWIANAFSVRAVTMEDGFVKEFIGYSGYSAVLVLAAFLSLYIGAAAIVTKFGKNKLQKFCFFTASLAISEWLRGFLFSGFPWNPFGLILAFDDNLLQICNFIGILGLTLLLILALSAVYFYKANGVLISGFLIFIIWGYGFFTLKNADNLGFEKINLRIVQPSIPQSQKWDSSLIQQNFKDYIDISTAKKSIKPDLVIWGETAVPFLSNDKMGMDILKDVAKNNNFDLITGIVNFSDENKYYNSMIYVSANEEPIFYDKFHLVPFGEYIPFAKYLPFKAFVESLGEFSKGAGIITIAPSSLGSISFSPLICYEAIFSGKAVLKKEKRPHFILNLTNDGWYGLGKGPHQHLDNVKIRSIEEGLPLIRAANNGISAVIDAYGRIIKSLPLDYKDSLDSPLPKRIEKSTFFSKYKNFNFFLIIFCLFALAFFKKSTK